MSDILLKELFLGMMWSGLQVIYGKPPAKMDYFPVWIQVCSPYSRKT